MAPNERGATPEATKSCLVCGRELRPRACLCPHCGWVESTQHRWYSPHGPWIPLLAVVLGVASGWQIASFFRANPSGDDIRVRSSQVVTAADDEGRIYHHVVGLIESRHWRSVSAVSLELRLYDEENRLVDVSQTALDVPLRWRVETSFRTRMPAMQELRPHVRHELFPYDERRP
ncbi:MAG: hypothetical protein AAF533_02220 [Acidobacteriota bacterium]